MNAQRDPPDSLVFECDFEEPPEKVWRALTEPQLLEAWLADDPRPETAGHDAAPQPPLPAPAVGPDRLDNTDRRADRKASQPGSSDFEVVTAEPHRLVRYRWRDREGGVKDSDDQEVHSVVTVELAPGPAGGTHLRLTHGEFRIVTATTPVMGARVTPITSARRGKAPILSLAAQSAFRRAA